MAGTFQISDGIVNTQDTFIDGSAAGVTLKGTTDLVNDELQYVVNVTPKLTASSRFTGLDGKSCNGGRSTCTR